MFPHPEYWGVLRFFYDDMTWLCFCTLEHDGNPKTEYDLCVMTNISLRNVRICLKTLMDHNLVQCHRLFYMCSDNITDIIEARLRRMKESIEKSPSYRSDSLYCTICATNIPFSNIMIDKHMGFICPDCNQQIDMEQMHPKVSASELDAFIKKIKQLRSKSK